jgi:hypothetical protein
MGRRENASGTYPDVQAYGKIRSVFATYVFNGMNFGVEPYLRFFPKR